MGGAVNIRSALILLACLAAITLGLFLKKSDLFTHPQFFAEDGVVLFTTAYYYGCERVLEPYSGYHILYQRLIACAGSWLPYEHVPRFYALSVLGTLCLVCVAIFNPRVVMPGKWIAAIALVLSPVGSEVFFGPTNSQWILSLLLLLLLVSEPPKTIIQRVYDLLIVAIAGLSGPFSLTYMPLFVLRLIWRRDTWSVFLLLACGSACIAQVYNFEEIKRITGEGGEFFDFVQAIAFTFGSMFIGPLALLRYSSESWISFLSVLSIITYSSVLLVAMRERSLELLVVTLAGMLIFIPTLYVFRDSPEVLAGKEVSRYAYVPTVCMVWMLLMLRLYHPRVATIGLVVMGVNLAVNFSFFQGPVFGATRWKVESQCLYTKNAKCTMDHPPAGWQTVICTSPDACR